MPFVVCCFLFVVWCLALCVVSCLVCVCCRLFVVDGLRMCIACCLLFVVSCSVCVARCL